MSQKIKITAIVVLGLFLFLIDQVFKYLIMAGDRVNIGYGWLRIEKATNAGIAFGINFNLYLLIPLYVAVIAILLYYCVKKIKSGELNKFFPLSIVIWGALSNFVDRVRFGYVVDYIYLKNFSVLNVADIMITLGITYFIYVNFFINSKIEKHENNS